MAGILLPQIGGVFHNGPLLFVPSPPSTARPTTHGRNEPREREKDDVGAEAKKIFKKKRRRETKGGRGGEEATDNDANTNRQGPKSYPRCWRLARTKTTNE